MIHQYQLNGYNIVLDICSGSVHAVDEVAYDIIAMFEEHDKDEIIAAMREKYLGKDDITEEDIEECKKLASSMGIPLRVREYTA
jgi:uncharacterized protein